MWTQFFFENAHFALNIFGALVMFAVAWLYFDAWTIRKSMREGIRVLGFVLLSLAFIIQASTIESNVLTQTLIPTGLHTILLFLTKLPGYILIVISVIIEPLQPKPPEDAVPNQPPTKPAAAFLTTGVVTGLGMGILYPLLALTAGIFYLRRATTGLERHLYKVSFSFLVIGISEILALRSMFIITTNVELYKLVVPFGPIWIIENILLASGLVVLCIWVFGYLLKRFETQLFMIFVTTVLTIFLITTVTFTGLLVKNLVDQTLQELQTDTQVLALAIDSKKGEALSDAQMIAQDPRIIVAITSGARRDVAQILSSYLLTKKQSNLLIVGTNTQIIASGEDINAYGSSLSSDTMIKRSLAGESVSSVDSNQGVLSPVVSVRSTTPIKNNGQIIGVVIASTAIDNALLDGIKQATGLEASLYGDNQLSATTLLASDGVTRPVGTTEENGQIKYTVLAQGKPYSGSVDLLNRSYLASYLPITNIDAKPIGMLFVGKPQISVIQTASRSIELTFLVAIVLLVFSVIPSYVISRYLVSQIR